MFCRPKSLLCDADRLFSDSDIPPANKLNAAFLICLSGTEHPLYSLASKSLQKEYDDSSLNELSDFYLGRLADIENEIAVAELNHIDFQRAITELEAYLTDAPSTEDRFFHEKVWQLFFPEGVGVFRNHLQRAETLRKSRIVRIQRTNPDSIKEPGHEILFTSNVLLGIPNKNTNISKLEYNAELRKALKQTMNEPQLFWYDHPVQIGVSPEANEILYGLSKLDKSLDEERKLGNLNKDKVKCVLSVSVTHSGLHEIAKDYIARELQDHCKLNNLEVYVFTENDTQLLIENVFLKITQKEDERQEMRKLLKMIGVDGEYGRHYSFLKAISAIWNVLIDPKIKATFKIDLDQVFAQKELIEQTGYSAFEHFKTPLWGATGIAKNSEEVELDMIAGALVNEKDIHKSLYTPDVVFPDKIPGKEANIFFSKMLMALSTEGELMTKYKENTKIDGRNKCIERIHVTGGTNGILVKALRKHRPFTPSFIGRAEDQCYILSVLANNSSPRLAYLHKDGLIMRHDKKAFASEAVKAAEFGNIIGDYIRMLYFTEYAKIICKDVSKLKKIIDPFTGCFVSRIPVTVCMLRFALKGAEFYEEGKENQGNRFLTENSRRLEKAIQFVAGNNSDLKIQAELERKGWNLFYDVLDKFESLIAAKDPSVSEIVHSANKIISNCKLRI